VNGEFGRMWMELSNFMVPLEHLFGKTERTINMLSIAYLQLGFEPGTYWLQITKQAFITMPFQSVQ
jgi:hypothetical protein